jgi:hypothetical protein
MTSGTQTHLLRLTPAPLYRFASTNPEVLDGAIFSYLWDTGTDPEFLLVLEARKTSDGFRWYFAPARFTYREVWLTYENREVWRGEKHNEFWEARVLRDNYVTCDMGVLDLDAIKAEFKDKE